MSIKEHISEIFLNKSNSYKFYKDHYNKNNKNNKELKKQNSDLKEEISNKEELITALMYGNKYEEDSLKYCPNCDKISYFEPFGTIPRKNAKCPVCNSLERDRFFSLILKKRFPQIFENSCNLLHFAPEENFYKVFSESENIDYYPVDINPERYGRKNMNIRAKVNMENIPYDDCTFDYIYNSHVLEHVPDDIKAMGELKRVLKDDGICLLTVPLFNIPTTLEKEEYNTPELRLKYYGQADHLRKYGNDFKERLESVGFNVEEITPKNIENDANKRIIFSLKDDERFFICKK